MAGASHTLLSQVRVTPPAPASPDTQPADTEQEETPDLQDTPEEDSSDLRRTRKRRKRRKRRRGSPSGNGDQVFREKRKSALHRGKELNNSRQN